MRRSLAVAMPAFAAVLAAGAPAATSPAQEPPAAVPTATAAPTPDLCAGGRFTQRKHATYTRAVLRERERISRRARRRMARMRACARTPEAAINMRRLERREARVRRERKEAEAAAAAAAEAMRGLEGTLAAIASCESHGDPGAVSRDGLYTGRYQFDDPTWRSIGGVGRAKDAPAAEQDRRAANLYRKRGAAPWPVCGR